MQNFLARKRLITYHYFNHIHIIYTRSSVYKSKVALSSLPDISIILSPTLDLFLKE